MLPFPSTPDWARTVNKRENKIEVLFCHCFYQTSLRKRVQIKSILKSSAFSIKCWDSAKNLTGKEEQGRRDGRDFQSLV